MENVILNAVKRTEKGGRVLKRLRAKGSVPAVLYGRQIESLPLTLKYSDIREILTKQGKSAFLKLFVEGQEYAAIIKDLRFDILNGNLLHVDLQNVSLTEKIQVEVPLRLKGREMIEKGGLVVNQQINNLTIECLPQDTPHFIEIEILRMKLGDVITASKVEIPEGATLVNDPDDVIVSLIEVRHDEQEEETEESEEVESEGEEEAVE